MMDEPWWEGRVASDVHCTLREKELKLPAFRAHSPLLKSRRFFVDILTLLSSHCQLCPAARHLAVYLLDHFMDRYDISTSKHLYTVAVSCLLLARNHSQGSSQATPSLPNRSGKFEDREDHVPKLEQINSTRILSSQNFTLTKKELLGTELLLLEAFGWNLCLPTPAHFLDYYLLASVSQKDHHCHSWPTTCPRKTKECLKEYAHYFLEVTLQDHVFYKFQPSVVAAACVGASRICLQLSPYWTRDLQRISQYSLEHLSVCIEILLVAYDNVLKDAVAVKSQALAMVPGSPPAPTQALFQPPAYPSLSQPPAASAPFQAPVQNLCLASRDLLQAHHPGGLLSGSTGSSLRAPYPALQPLEVCPMPLPASLSMQMAITAEPRHCLATTYGSSYFSGSHVFPTGCFDR
ncbi:cyclin-J-like protein isoform X1 [Elephas maximus indicus]|uniref:cyclin-J-like protein isoform X1 n=1 Tax=Elephas maximus indicus TaxID=99487 RepID=UPI0021160A8D|nr:cyclin-J-like protein isoform X1 [Elephas maximus indicus]XP_049730203.1 cyclin-J-like protein isoform X1 [Elephas maximus indicus]